MSDVRTLFRLAPRFVERIWGRHDLRPWYGETGIPGMVGEVWLTGPECVIETGALTGKTLEEGCPGFPLLVKMLFPSEKLSVQVHPDDDLARRTGHARGKTECWYVLESQPGASVALGLKPGVDVAQVKAAVLGGTLEDLLNHVPVAAGEMYYVDAGTIHAIGGGSVLLETQQTSDITYRLYDYGRPRELHLEQGLIALKTGTRAGLVAPKKMDGFVRLIEEKYFTVDRFDVPAGSMTVDVEGVGCIVGLKGTGSVNGLELQPGHAVVAPQGADALEIVSSAELSFARCFALET
ncbi:MAG TPA: class I mannose-6-phosphate isomerase [Granulicella sp.]